MLAHLVDYNLSQQYKELLEQYLSGIQVISPVFAINVWFFR